MKAQKAATPKEMLICGVVFCLIVGSCFFVMSRSENGEGGGSEVITLNAKITLVGDTLAIQNKDSFPWLDIKLDLNGGVFKSGYVYPGAYKKLARIGAGQTHRVPLAEFAKGDGARFNRASTKPQKITVICKTAKGDAVYSATW